MPSQKPMLRQIEWEVQNGPMKMDLSTLFYFFQASDLVLLTKILGTGFFLWVLQKIFSNFFYRTPLAAASNS